MVLLIMVLPFHCILLLKIDHHKFSDMVRYGRHFILMHLAHEYGLFWLIINGQFFFIGNYKARLSFKRMTSLLPCSYKGRRCHLCLRLKYMDSCKWVQFLVNVKAGFYGANFSCFHLIVKPKTNGPKNCRMINDIFPKEKYK